MKNSKKCLRLSLARFFREGKYVILRENLASESLKAMLHDAIFLATCNAVLLFNDVKLPNTSFYFSLLMHSPQFQQSLLINISQAWNNVASCKKNSTV